MSLQHYIVMVRAAEKILFIGADEQSCTLLQRGLKAHELWKNCLTDWMPRLEKAIAELSVKEYQLIFADCEHLTNSPLEVIIELRGITRGTPVILLNKPGMEKTAISCLKNGANHYIIKDKEWTHQVPLIAGTILDELYYQNKSKKRLFLLEQENERLRQLSTLDETTLFYTASHFQALLSRELKRATRYGFHLACLVLDVKKNDSANNKNYGDVYEQLGLMLKSVVRSCDIWARLQQNRFAALLPHTNLQEAKNAMKRIENEIKSSPLMSLTTKSPFKVSWGWAKFDEKKFKNEAEFLSHVESTIK